MKAVGYIFNTVCVVLLLGIAGLFLASLLPIPGNIEIKIVKSGSMVPKIPTGSLVIIKPATDYRVGDVITFGPDTKTQIPTTHRIASIKEEGGSTVYTTKGDANEEADTKTITNRDIIGKVFVVVPYAGYILDFAKQPIGFALLIGVPAVVIILDELWNIFIEIKNWRGRKKGKGEDEGPPPQSPSDTIQRKIIYKRERETDDVAQPIYIHIRHADKYLLDLRGSRFGSFRS